MNNNRLSRNQFLNRLPKTIIHKGGDIVSIRDDVNKRLQGVYNSTTTTPTTTSVNTTVNTTNTTTATANNNANNTITDLSNSNNYDDDNKNNIGSNNSTDNCADSKSSLSIFYDRKNYVIGNENNNISKNNHQMNIPIDKHLNIKCLIKTKASSSSSSRPSSSSSQLPPSSQSSSSSISNINNMITTIQIKLIDQPTIIAKMYSYETIGDLKSYIIQHFTSSSSTSLSLAISSSSSTAAADKASSLLEFEIRSAYPSKVLG